MNEPRRQDQIPARIETVIVGEQLGPVEIDIREEDVEAYGDNVQDGGSLLTLADGRHAAPATITAGDYVKVMGVKYSPAGAIHTKAAHEFKKAIVAPAKLSASGVIVDKYIRRGREFVVIESVTVDETGAEVVRSRNTWMMNPSVHHPESENTR